MEKIIDFQSGLYIGKVENSLSSYISALTEVMNKYGKTHTYNKWVQEWETSDSGQGHYKQIEVIALQNFDCIAYVNRAFAFPELLDFKKLSMYFDHVPTGGKFHISQYIERLKSHL